MEIKTDCKYYRGPVGKEVHARCVGLKKLYCSTETCAFYKPKKVVAKVENKGNNVEGLWV